MLHWQHFTQEPSTRPISVQNNDIADCRQLGYELPSSASWKPSEYLHSLKNALSSISSPSGIPWAVFIRVYHSKTFCNSKQKQVFVIGQV